MWLLAIKVEPDFPNPASTSQLVADFGLKLPGVVKQVQPQTIEARIDCQLYASGI